MQHRVYSLELYPFSSTYVMYFFQFLLTQPFRGLGYVAHILRLRKRASKSHRATQITAGQDSDIARGLAGIFLCISVIMELSPHARHPHYLIIIWQMSVQLTGWSLCKPPSPTRMQRLLVMVAFRPWATFYLFTFRLHLSKSKRSIYAFFSF